jgi:RNase P subunit RPR2
MFSWLLKIFSKPKKKQSLKIYCLYCNTELISSDSFVSDTYDCHNNNHVIYKCKNCGNISDYNFDIAPIPINWKQLK